MGNKRTLKIILVAGARPNFMKIAPLLHEMNGCPGIEPLLIHTGQHYDENMSDLFFRELGIPEPGMNLGIGSGSHAEQTARILEKFEKICLEEKPDAVLVVGDVNSAAACTLAAAKLHITTLHYEAGLRSHDRSMPEEINRLVTDAIADIFFTTSDDADQNLIQEGHKKDKIFMVGNLMIDALKKNLEKAESIDMVLETLEGRNIQLGKDFIPGQYGLMTFHRPANVDRKESLENLVEQWITIAAKVPLIFPVHPRTWKNLRLFGLEEKIWSSTRLFLIAPVGYLQFINLMRHSQFVLTDSGGIQEETTYLHIPCLTVRTTTERPVTLWEGSNKLIKIHEMVDEVQLILEGKGKTGKVPRLWDGKSAQRIIRVILKVLQGHYRPGEPPTPAPAVDLGFPGFTG
jgi:UDP-N-acetylglucosamine 2-epimerase (non-hydrolysing)